MGFSGIFLRVLLATQPWCVHFFIAHLSFSSFFATMLSKKPNDYYETISATENEIIESECRLQHKNYNEFNRKCFSAWVKEHLHVFL
jgi:hypothetical protein